jgi:hypothetical protein
VIAAIEIIKDSRIDAARAMVAGLLTAAENQRLIARRIVRELPQPIAGPAVALLLSLVNSHLKCVVAA